MFIIIIFIKICIRDADKILGMARPKKVLDALENDTKANFLENIIKKIRFQKNWGGRGGGAMAPLVPHSFMANFFFEIVTNLLL